MIPTSTVLLLNQHPARPLTDHIATLQRHSVAVIEHTELQSLCVMASRYVGHAMAPWAIVLAGPPARNCMAATHLRALFPSAGILALVDSGRKTVLKHTLQSGVDTCCRDTASASLLMANLHPLIARIAVSVPPQTPKSPEAAVLKSMPDAPGWTLIERGWVLLGPQQQRMRLTIGERAFIATLVAAPGLRADYPRLILAVSSGYAAKPTPMNQARLIALVSRLRHKFCAQGSEPPLRSVHRWGYMFTAPITQQAGTMRYFW